MRHTPLLPRKILEVNHVGRVPIALFDADTILNHQIGHLLPINQDDVHVRIAYRLPGLRRKAPRCDEHPVLRRLLGERAKKSWMSFAHNILMALEPDIKSRDLPHFS